METDSPKGTTQGAYSLYFSTVFLLVLVMLLYLWGHVRTMSQSRELAQLQNDRQALVRQQGRLAAEATRLKQSSRIREIASRKLGMVFPSEQPRNLYLKSDGSARTRAEKRDAD